MESNSNGNRDMKVGTVCHTISMYIPVCLFVDNAYSR